MRELLKKAVAFCLVIVFVVCSSETVDAATTFTYVAHRGDMTEAPEESLAALQVGVKNGYKNLEVDVWETNSGAFIVFHDNNLRRLCKVDKSIFSLTSENYKKYPYYKTYNDEVQYILSVDQALKFCYQNRVKLYIHVKSLKSSSKSAKKLLNKIVKADMQKKVVLITSSKAILSNLKRTQKSLGIKGIHYGVVGTNQSSGNREYVYQTAKQFKCSWAIFNYNVGDPSGALASRTLVSKCHKANIKISCYGIVNTKEIARIQKRGYDGAICNKVVFE